METIELEDRVPSEEEYRRLRASVGWSTPRGCVTKAGLASSRFAVTARRADGHAVGMARVVGDGNLYLSIVDVIVEPSEQRSDIGKQVIDRVIAWAREHAQDGHLTLTASEETLSFYSRWPFRETGRSLIFEG